MLNHSRYNRGKVDIALLCVLTAAIIAITKFEDMDELPLDLLRGS